MDEYQGGHQCRPRKTLIARIFHLESQYGQAGLVEELSAESIWLVAHRPPDIGALLLVDLPGVAPIGAWVTHRTRLTDENWEVQCKLLGALTKEELAGLLGGAEPSPPTVLPTLRGHPWELADASVPLVVLCPS